MFFLCVCVCVWWSVRSHTNPFNWKRISDVRAIWGETRLPPTPLLPNCLQSTTEFTHTHTHSYTLAYIHSTLRSKNEAFSLSFTLLFSTSAARHFFPSNIFSFSYLRFFAIFCRHASFYQLLHAFFSVFWYSPCLCWCVLSQTIKCAKPGTQHSAARWHLFMTVCSCRRQRWSWCWCCCCCF